MRRHRHHAIAAIALLLRGNEALPTGLRELSQEDPLLARLCAGLITRLERGESLDLALIAERLLSADEAAALGQEPLRSLEHLLRRWETDRQGTALLRWYPLWVAAWWMLPCLILTMVVEGVAGHPFPLANSYGNASDWLTPTLALKTGLVFGCWAIICAILAHRWMLPVTCLLIPRARRALIARRLLDQAATGSVPRTWWWERTVWYFSGIAWAPPEHDPITALINDRLLLRDADGRPDWERSHAAVEVEIAQAMRPARAALVFGLALATIAGFADFVQVPLLISAMSFESFPSAPTILSQAMLIGGLILLPIPMLVGRWLVMGWRWNPVWPQIANQLASALERGEPALRAVGLYSPHLPLSVRLRLDDAWQELCAGSSDSLMTILCRTGVVNATQRPAALAAEQAGREALIAWLRREGSVETTHGVALAQLHAQLVLCVLITVYLTTGVLPKFLTVFHSVGLSGSEPWSLTVTLALFSSWWPALLIVALVVGSVISFRCGWWPSQRERRRLHRGDLLVRGMAAGRTETELANIVAWTWHRPPPHLVSIAADGDWNRLMSLCGWGGSTPDTLAEAVDRARLRHGRSQTCALAIGAALVPLLTAIPVGMAMHSVMSSIMVMQRQVLDVAEQDPGGAGRYAAAVIYGPEPVMLVPLLRDPLHLGPRPPPKPSP